MLTCINKNSEEYRALLKKSGLNEFVVEAYCRHYMLEFDRFPKLDEIPGADSSKYFNELFQVNNNATKIDTILLKTGTSSIEEAVIEINKIYSDYETYVLPLGESALIKRVRRPSKYAATLEGIVDNNPANFIIFSEVLDKLSLLYGINIIPISTSEIKLNLELKNIPNASIAKAFVYNSNIYVNIDIASIDSPIHELLHILLGSMSFTNPELYSKLIQSTSQFKGFDSLRMSYQNRTLSDILEEIFISEFAKYLVGESSEIELIDNKQKYEIFYNINRVLDTILLGEATVKSINKSELVNMSLRDLAIRLNSESFSNSFLSMLDDAQIHRTLANTKELLMKELKLLEVCD